MKNQTTKEVKKIVYTTDEICLMIGAIRLYETTHNLSIITQDLYYKLREDLDQRIKEMNKFN